MSETPFCCIHGVPMSEECRSCLEHDMSGQTRMVGVRTDSSTTNQLPTSQNQIGSKTLTPRPDGYWWCRECRCECSPKHVTFGECHEDCGHPVEWITPHQRSLINALERKLAEAKAEVEKYMLGAVTYNEEIYQRGLDIRDLKAEVERLRGALAFYADPYSYCCPFLPPGQDDRCPVLRDDGVKARIALAAKEAK